MSTIRRRGGGESDRVPETVSIESYDRHEGKLKNYNQNPVVNNFPDNNTLPEVEIMTARDRTKEFTNTIQNLQSRNIAKAINIRDPKKSMFVQSHAQFMMIARTIGKNIANTYSKLEKLTLCFVNTALHADPSDKSNCQIVFTLTAWQMATPRTFDKRESLDFPWLKSIFLNYDTLAKRKSLFEDRSMEIQELTYIIKEDLNSLNQQIAELQEVAKNQKKGQQNGKQHLVSHSSSVLLALQSKLANMSTEFKQVLEVRTENLKQQKTRRDQFSDSSFPTSINANANKGGSLLLQEEQININMEPVVGPDVPFLQSQTQVNYDQTNAYLQSRAETMQNIESTIVELGGIYQQLAHMVKEQEEMVDRIDSNLEVANLNVEAAHSEILKYFQSVTSNRWLMIKVFGILIMFFIFFVVFLS